MAMMGARGVALGLNLTGGLNDLNRLGTMGQQRLAIIKKKKEKEALPKVKVEKRVDRQTLWAACRALVFGVTLLLLGAGMATVGFYAVPLARTGRTVNGTLEVDPARRMQLASMSYVGPVIMGVGAFILMIACVMTLESRDKHARIIHEVRDPKGGVKRKFSRHLFSAIDKAKTPKGREAEAGGGSGSGGAGGGESRAEDPTEASSRLLDQSSLSETAEAEAPTEAESRPPLATYADGKFPSTSCLEHVGAGTDARGLLQRFLDEAERGLREARAKAGPYSTLAQVPSVDEEVHVHAPPRGPAGATDVRAQAEGLERPLSRVSLEALPPSVTLLKARPPGYKIEEHVKRLQSGGRGRAPLVEPEALGSQLRLADSREGSRSRRSSREPSRSRLSGELDAASLASFATVDEHFPHEHSPKRL